MGLAANDATNVLNNLLEERLTKPNGSERKLATIPTEELIDRYSIPPCYRMWVWEDDLEEATESLNLLTE